MMLVMAVAFVVMRTVFSFMMVMARLLLSIAVVVMFVMMVLMMVMFPLFLTVNGDLHMGTGNSAALLFLGFNPHTGDGQTVHLSKKIFFLRQKFKEGRH